MSDMQREGLITDVCAMAMFVGVFLGTIRTLYIVIFHMAFYLPVLVTECHRYYIYNTLIPITYNSQSQILWCTISCACAPRWPWIAFAKLRSRLLPLENRRARPPVSKGGLGNAGNGNGVGFEALLFFCAGRILRGVWKDGRPMQQGSKNPWFDFDELQKEAKAAGSEMIRKAWTSLHRWMTNTRIPWNISSHCSISMILNELCRMPFLMITCSTARVNGPGFHFVGCNSPSARHHFQRQFGPGPTEKTGPETLLQLLLSVASAIERRLLATAFFSSSQEATIRTRGQEEWPNQAAARWKLQMYPNVLPVFSIQCKLLSVVDVCYIDWSNVTYMNTEITLLYHTNWIYHMILYDNYIIIYNLMNWWVDVTSS